MVNNTLLTQSGAKIMLDVFSDSTPTYSILTKFRVSINTPDITWSDTSVTTNIPITGTETASDCSTIVGWSTTAGTLSLNTTTFKPDGGTDGALNFIKSSTATLSIDATKATTSLDGTSKDFTMWFYVKDSTVLSKLNATTALLIRYGSDASNYYQKLYGASSLSTGWNFIKLAIPSGFTVVSSPTTAALDYTYFETNASTITDTFATGDLIFDAIRLASSGDYLKSIDSTTLDTTDASVSFVSKLAITEANGFLIDGIGLVNTDGTELVGIKSKFPSNSKDTTDLFKITTKIKVRNVNQI